MRASIIGEAGISPCVLGKRDKSEAVWFLFCGMGGKEAARRLVIYSYMLRSYRYIVFFGRVIAFW